MVYEIVYASRVNHFAFSTGLLEDMLGRSRVKNRSLDVTGVLLYEKGEFIQLLEGPRDAVRHLYYDCISRDPRHRRVFLCWESEKKSRGFADWSMGLTTMGELAQGLSGNTEGLLKHGLSGLDLSPPRSTGRDLLLSLYQNLASCRG